MSDDRDTIYKMQREMAEIREAVIALAVQAGVIAEGQSLSDIMQNIDSTKWKDD